MRPLIVAVLRLGLPMGPMVLLTVQGRKSGQPRTTPVGLFERNGQRWLFAQFGQVQWVRNLRASRRADIRRGRRHESVAVVELSPRAAASVLHDVVLPWFGTPMGAMAALMGGGQPFSVSMDAPVDDFAKEVERHPIFEVHPAQAADWVAQTIKRVPAVRGQVLLERDPVIESP